MTGRKKPGNAPRSGGGRPHGSRRPVGDRIVKRIQCALSLDLLHRNYRSRTKGKKQALVWATRDHCYVATEAAYHLFGKGLGYEPHARRNADGSTHWWLRHLVTGDVIDATRPQLEGRPYPYKKGHRQPFLTKRPSSRAAELIRRVRRTMSR